MKIAPVITALGAVSAVAVVFLYAPAPTAQPTSCMVSLQPSVPSPQFVGERIIWTATAANCGAAPVYQFSVAGRAERGERGRSEHERAHHHFAMVRDFSLDKSFAWAPMEEGAYEVSVKSRTGSTA